MVQFLIATPDVVPDAKGNDGWTPLWRVGAKEDREMINLLLVHHSINLHAIDD
jgi:hypothetical protein